MARRSGRDKNFIIHYSITLARNRKITFRIISIIKSSHLLYIYNIDFARSIG